MILCAFSTISLFSQREYRQYAKQVRKTEKQLTKTARANHSLHSKGRQATPDLYWVQEFTATMDPKLGRPDPDALLYVLQSVNDRKALTSRAMPGLSVTPWVERGPNNIGGRTRALTWDPNDANGKKVWAGAVTGGLWYNNDITNSSSKWVQVSSLWSNLTVSCMAWDPNNTAVGYVGTGEGFGVNASTSRGFGVWKTTDSGKTWNQISNTSTWYYINDIVVRNESGSSVVYVAVDAYPFQQSTFHGLSTYGLQRSTNGGTSWTNVISNAANGQKYAIADLEIGADNLLWAGTKVNPYSGADRGGSRILTSSNGTSWSVSYTHSDKTGRVEVACAPGKAYTVYAMIEASQKVDAIIATYDRGANWTSRNEPVDADQGIPSTDFSRNQAWYDLILAVDPNDSLTVYAGAINWFRSTNGGSNWTQISKWANNANMNTLSCPYVHADQHAFVFKPGSSSTCIIGSDGGVFYSSNITNAASSSSAIVDRNNGYITTQYYWGDQASGSGSNVMIAGSQDNGTQRFTSAGLNNGAGNTVTGGDGAYCFISPSSSSKQISSYVYNQYYYTTNAWTGSNPLIADGTTGKFINPAEWDDNGPGLFSGKGTGAIYRIKLTTSPGTLETVTWTATGNVSALKAYKLGNGKTRLFIGTDAGKLYVTSDAWATTPVFTDITNGINAGNISGIFAQRGGDTMAVTLSNYGITSVYISTNGGSSWSSREGNLPNMPVWSIVLNPNSTGEAVIATEVGVYGTTNFFNTSPTWATYNTGMGSVKMATLRYRESDRMLMAVTHGRGVFTSDAWAKTLPIANFGTSNRDVCTNQTVAFTDSTLNDPTSWSWTFSPRNFTYMQGTDSTSKNPFVRFTKGGVYQVKLTATNTLGNNTLTRNSWITVTDTIAGSATTLMSKTAVCSDDTFTLRVTTPLALTGSITTYSWRKNNIAQSSSAAYSVKPTVGDSFYCIITSNKKCVSPTTIKTNTVKPTVNAIVNASLDLTSPQACSGRTLKITGTGTNLGSSPAISWFKNGSSAGTSGLTFNETNPTTGDKFWATVNVAGLCVRPANLIYSDTITLSMVNTTPSKPTVSRNFDTMIAENIGSGLYQWFSGNGLTGTGRKLKVSQNGNYRCVYTESGCASDTSTAIIFNSLSLQGVNQYPLLRPNPAKAYVEVPYVCGNTVSVYSVNGALISTLKAEMSTPGNQQFNISTLKPGVYILSSGQDCRFRFIKE